MSVVVITPPDELVVSLEEAKAHLRVDHEDDDDYIEAIIQAATASIDGPSGWLDQCLVTQTLEMTVDDFGCGGVDLKFPPIIEIVRVLYDDENGAEQTLADDIYRLTGAQRAPRLSLAYGKSWPSLRWQSGAVRIQYDAGFGETGADVPAPIRHAILLIIGHLYENRQAVIVDGGAAVELPQAVQALLSPFRIFRT